MADIECIGNDKEHVQAYYEIMSLSDAEIVLVSKAGAVEDLNSIMNGCSPFGRRRVNQVNEESQRLNNIDAMNSMFEVMPFSSINELIDLEDYVILHQKLDKYKKGNSKDQLVYKQKVEDIRKDIQKFQR